VIVLGYLGTNAAYAYLLHARIAPAWIRSPGTLCRFLCFQSTVPLVGKMESMGPLPHSIAKPVHASTALAD
jgi:hypothetical protein